MVHKTPWEAVPMDKKTKRVAGYIRVSTSEQAEHGGGLEVQERAIREHCEREGFELVKVYRERGVSGANGVEDRQALPVLLMDLEAGEFGAVIVTRLDRLARDLILQETIIADLRKRKAALVSLAEPDLCSDDPGRVLVRQIMGSIAEYEKKIIAARLTAGRRQKKRGGGYMGGFVPLGYTVKGLGRAARVVRDPRGAALVNHIFEVYAGGASLQTIAEDLQEQGIPQLRAGGNRKTNGWRKQTVGAIIRNEAYMGREFPAIIPADLFERCAARREEARKR